MIFECGHDSDDDLGLRIEGKDEHFFGQGNLVAHDILEHNPKSGLDPYADEIYATGALYALRVETGLLSDDYYDNMGSVANEIRKALHHSGIKEWNYKSKKLDEPEVEEFFLDAARMGVNLYLDYGHDIDRDATIKGMVSLLRMGYRWQHRRCRKWGTHAVARCYSSLAHKINNVLYDLKEGDKLEVKFSPAKLAVKMRLV